MNENPAFGVCPHGIETTLSFTCKECMQIKVPSFLIKESGYYRNITMRQWYAAKFAAAWVIALKNEKNNMADETIVDYANRMALEQADALLAHEEGGK